MTTTLHSEFSERIVSLCDGRPGLRGCLHVEARAPEPATANPQPSIQHPEPAILDFISSDDTLDRYDEIIVPEGWQLANYQRNPVFQNAHQYGDIIFTLGKALITEVRGGTNSASPHLFQRIEFATDVNPMARIAYGLYKGKFLNAVSVGFIPLRWENADGTVSPRQADSPVHRSGTAEALSAGHPAGAETPCAGDAARREARRQPRRKYLEQELLEVSAVGIPANPNALALACKSGAIEKSDLRDLAELLRQVATGSFSNPLADSPSAIHQSAAPSVLLSLARDLRSLLRRC
jgi:hypothetical protein